MKEVVSAQSAAERLEIHLLGTFQISHQGRPLTAFQADRPQALLAYLLLHRHAPQPRRHLAFLLWPDSTESQALNNLRNLLHTVRRALPDADRYLAVDSLTLQWRSDAPFSLDVANFEQALAAAKQASEPTAVRSWLEQAISLHTGELLPANYDEWLMPLREALTHRYQSALLQLVELLAGACDYQTAVTYGQRLFQQDPLNESHVVRLMQLHALAGDRSAIRRVYQNCVTVLAQELGVEPDSATQDAYEQLLNQVVVSTPSLTETAESQRPLSPAPRPLPTPATPFIGREVELHEVGQLLADPHCRLLTITGPGGMGKTRLALQTAVAQQPNFRDGVAYVSLRSLNSADFLAATIANALNLPMSAQLDTTVQLLHLLSSKKMLILLDNFEHLLDGVTLIADILAQTTGIKLLVTSRQRLDLQEEWSFALGELSLPTAAAPEEIDGSSAVALFVQSARRADSRFNLTPADYAAVIEICRLVGGLPLGIELAASWTRLLSCGEIAQEIERGIDFLSVTTRNMPSQHHNLRAVFDQSWALLTAEERQLLQTLAIFPGSFSRPAAGSVAGATLPTLSGLIDKSLLRRMGTDQYSLHELVRQYAAEQLRANEQVWRDAQEKHGRFYLVSLAESEVEIFSSLRGPALEMLTANIDNLRVAWEWGLEEQQWPLLLRVTRAYPTFYELHSWSQEGLHMLMQAVAQVEPIVEAEPDDSIARLFFGAILSSNGWFHFRCGQMAAARAAIDKAIPLIRVALAHEYGERCLQFSLYQLGMVAFVTGDYAAAETASHEALAISQALADDWGMSYTWGILGMVRFAQGEAAAGYELLRQSIAAWGRNGSPRLGVLSLSFFSEVARALGKHDEAETAMQEGLTLAQQAGDRYGVATFLHSLGDLRLGQGAYNRAVTAVQDSLVIFTEIGDSWRITQGQALLATIFQAQGDAARAEKAFREAFATAIAARALPYALTALAGLAELYAQTGRETSAYALAEQITSHPASSGPAKARAGKLIEHLRQSGVEETAVYPDESLETAVVRILAAITASPTP